MKVAPPHIVIPAKSLPRTPIRGRYPVPASWIPVYVEAMGRPHFHPHMWPSQGHGDSGLELDSCEQEPFPIQSPAVAYRPGGYGKPGTLSAPIWRHHGELVSRGNSVRHRDHGDVDGLRPGPGLRRAHQPGRDLRHGASRTSAPPVSSRPRTGASKTRLASQSTVYARYATRSKTGLGRCWSRSPASRTLHDTISLRAPAAPSPIWNPQPTLCSYYDMGNCSGLRVES